ncbi:MAG TPA: O-antigen ligase family protein [Candidatus Eremiobacteraceae bacterium]|nr:O-antigen ligase family protein [Candidatus Eremiobacteraceae bacterium]
MRLSAPVAGPLFGLLVLALADVLTQPYTAEVWSVFAAKWVVPFALFVVAARIFEDEVRLREFETFALLVFAYLGLTSIFFLIGAKGLIFPRFILDEAVGIHADRARGPFLQAVANGVALNLLGLIALDSFRRRRLRGLLALALLVGLPLAIVATKTRAVWLSFAASIVVLPFFCSSHRLRRGCVCIVVCGALGLLALIGFPDHRRSLGERLQENGPVKFRVEIYQAGWQMFVRKPVTGWGATKMQAELSRRINDFRQEQYYFHNTYLEILIQYGLIGLGLYFWVVIDLFRVGRRGAGAYSRDGVFLDEKFRTIWPVMLLVYLLNASFVVMNYQFVNGFLFSLAGMLHAQNRREESNAG